MSGDNKAADERFHVVAYDFGAKSNILRMLVERGCRLTVVPAQTSAADVLAMNPDGVFLSNGPGDPEPCDYAITAIQKLLAADLPTFWYLLRASIIGISVRCKNSQNEVWPSWCQSSCAGRLGRPSDDYQSKPWLCSG